MKPSPIPYQSYLDQQLKNHYHQICFNPKKRQVLLRLADCSSQLAEEGFIINEQLSNKKLKRYINGVYHKYGIQDPIKREFRLAKQSQSFNITINGSPQTSLNLTQITQTDRLTKTKRKIINLKENFKHDNQDIISASNLIQTEVNLSHSNFLTNRSRMSKQIGYRTKEKISFKSLPKGDFLGQIQKPIINHHFIVQRSDHSKIALSFNNPQVAQTSRIPPQTQNKQIPIVFRYCPMCQQTILQNNIYFHQSRCKDIQMAYHMPYAHLQQIIINKIQRLEREIFNQFISKDQKAVIKQFKQLKEIVSSWLIQKDKSQSFDKVRDGFLNLGGITHQKISKLNWFKNLRKKIAMQRSFQFSQR